MRIQGLIVPVSAGCGFGGNSAGCRGKILCAASICVCDCMATGGNRTTPGAHRKVSTRRGRFLAVSAALKIKDLAGNREAIGVPKAI